MKKPNVSPLKIISLALGFAGMVIATELQKRETEQIVEKVIAEREAKSTPPQIEQ